MLLIADARKSELSVEHGRCKLIHKEIIRICEILNMKYKKPHITGYHVICMYIGPMLSY